MEFNFFFYFIFLISFLLFIYSIYRLYEHFKIVFGKKKKFYKKRISINLSLNILFALLFLFVSLTFVFLFFSLRTYDSLTKEKIVGRLICRKVKGENHKIEIDFMPVSSNLKTINSKVINGDLWAVDAYILKWHPFVNIFGIHTAYKLSTIYGKYEKPEDEINKKHKLLILGNNKNKFWKYLMKYEKKIPLVEGIYGSSVFQYPSNENIFLIKISRTGLTIEKI
ncbi:MAG TPA: hypothetical protein VKN74_03180 [Candidatus Mcinerneyibacterium sp.]|nr:hypothetical protein [Candidatus Mcinerneyibacterium sp.]